MTTIQIELPQSLEAKLDKILNLLEGLGGISVAPARQEAQKAEPVNPVQEAQKAEPVKATTETQAPPASEPVKTYSKADVQQAVVKASAAGYKAQVREIVTKYAPRVSEIPEDKYGEVMDALSRLGV